MGHYINRLFKRRGKNYQLKKSNQCKKNKITDVYLRWPYKYQVGSFQKKIFFLPPHYIMKAKVNLHNYNSISGNKRLDTYQFSPYSKKSQEDTTTIVDREDRLNTAYNSNYDQACLLLQAIQANSRRRLSTECIRKVYIALHKFISGSLINFIFQKKSSTSSLCGKCLGV